MDLVSQIEESAIDGDIIRSLRLCLKLGGEYSNSNLRRWALQELEGYSNQEDLPDYRYIYAPLYIDGTTLTYMIHGERISNLNLPESVRDDISEKVPFFHSLPELVQLVSGSELKNDIAFEPPNAALIMQVMNIEYRKEGCNIRRLYWSVSRSSIHGIIEHIKTKLVQLTAEIRSLMSDDNTAPSSETVQQAFNITIKGDQNQIAVNNSEIDTDRSKRSESKIRRTLQLAAWIATVVSLIILCIIYRNELGAWLP